MSCSKVLQQPRKKKQVGEILQKGRERSIEDLFINCGGPPVFKLPTCFWASRGFSNQGGINKPRFALYVLGSQHTAQFFAIEVCLLHPCQESSEPAEGQEEIEAPVISLVCLFRFVSFLAAGLENVFFFIICWE